jgi:hypothetical protein
MMPLVTRQEDEFCHWPRSHQGGRRAAQKDKLQHSTKKAPHWGAGLPNLFGEVRGGTGTVAELCSRALLTGVRLAVGYATELTVKRGPPYLGSLDKTRYKTPVERPGTQT